jgi:hypothetical protein
MADESVPSCVICPGFFKTMEHLQSRKHMLKAVEYDYMITPQISAIKSELRAELDKEKRKAQEKAEQEREAYKEQTVRENNMLYMQRQEQETGTSTLKYCSCCDKQTKRKNWVAHEKSQGHIRMSMAMAVEEKEAQLITDIMNYEPRQEQDLKYCSFCDKHVSGKNWNKHIRTKGHIDKSMAVNAEEQAEMNGLANKICSFCNVPFASWAQHKQDEAHKLNWAEAALAKLST